MAQHDPCRLETELFSNLRPSSMPQPIQSPVLNRLGVWTLKLQFCVELLVTGLDFMHQGI
jgi:hypothetical protein